MRSTLGDGANFLTIAWTQTTRTTSSIFLPSLELHQMPHAYKNYCSMDDKPKSQLVAGVALTQTQLSSVCTGLYGILGQEENSFSRDHASPSSSVGPITRQVV